MGAILGAAVKIASIAVLFLIPIFLISSLFGKSNKKKGGSAGSLIAVFIYFVIALFGGSLILFGFDTDSQGAVVTGTAIAAVALLLALLKMRRRR